MVGKKMVEEILPSQAKFEFEKPGAVKVVAAAGGGVVAAPGDDLERFPRGVGLEWGGSTPIVFLGRFIATNRLEVMKSRFVIVS